MNNNSNRLLMSLLLSAAIGMVAFSGTRRAAQGAQNVVVTNSTSQAIPVKPGGTFDVTVANSIGQPLPVKQNGNWYMGLSGVPNIHVANNSSAPIPSSITNSSSNPIPSTITNPTSSPVPISDRDDQGRNAYSSLYTGSVAAYETNAEIGFPSAPVGKRLIVTHCSVQSQGNAPDLPCNWAMIQVISPLGGGGSQHFFALSYPPGESMLTMGSTDCFIPVDLDQSGSVTVNRPSTGDISNPVSFVIQVEGYTVSVP